MTKKEKGEKKKLPICEKLVHQKPKEEKNPV